MEVTQLIADLKSPTAATRATVAEQLSHLENGAQAAAVELTLATADADDSVRQWATAALESLGPPSAADAQKLVSLLADPRNDVAYWAATLLGRLGAAQLPLPLGEDRGEGAASGATGSASAASGTGNILSCSDIVTGLTTALTTHPEIPVRQRAAWALGQIGPAAIAALPALQKSSSASDPRLSRLAKQVIEQISAAN